MRHSLVLWLVCFWVLLGAPSAEAQSDAAARARQQEVEEQQRRVNARLQALEEALQSIQHELNSLRAEMRNQREDRSKANPATQASLRQLEEKIERVEKNTVENFAKLERLITSSNKGRPAPAATPAAPKGKTYEYEVREGDTLTKIVNDLKEQGLKVSPKDVEKANPKVDWQRLKIGSTIIIPVPER